MFRGALKLNEFCAWAGIGRTTAYEEIGSGRLTIVKVGRRSLIRISDAENWLSELKALSKPRECGANNFSGDLVASEDRLGLSGQKFDAAKNPSR